MARPILTAAEMRAAEGRTIAAGTSETRLMERAGAALAEAIRLYAGPRETLLLCGPGNNGGDGYVAARYLKDYGYPVRVAALADPKTEASKWARKRWDGAVEQFENAEPASILVDCLFGTGLSRELEDIVAERLKSLAEAAVVAVAGDLPSGVGSDDGAIFSAIATFDLTVAFGALKPAHRLMPAMAHMGRVVLADIGIEVGTAWQEIGRPIIPPLHPAGHKFDRGMVVVMAGDMPGAAALAASASARAGAGYVRLKSRHAIANVPAAVVQGQAGGIDDARIDAVLVGPGLGTRAKAVLDEAIECGRPLVLDADALRPLGDPALLQDKDAIITPHEGEFARLFPDISGPKPGRALEAARRSGAVVVLKGADTLVASPDGRLAFAPPAPAWLASAGTGDVLAGIVAAMRARGMAPFEAACAAAWVHGRAAEAAGPNMIADDLVDHIPAALK